MRLNKIALRDKKIFLRYLKSPGRRLAAYSFENIYIWSSLFDIRWQVIGGRLCVFFRDNIGSFLYLPPLGGPVCPGALAEAFAVMDSFNANREVSRIENVEAGELDGFRRLGYSYREGFCEYLYARKDLARLKGEGFKSKRSCCNYFTGHYDFEYLDFAPEHKKACLDLYESWAAQRRLRNADTSYSGMLKDSGVSLRRMFYGYRYLGFSGRLVRAAGRVKAFTFGYELNKEVFCILYEVADLSLKGLAQFIFRSFCADCGSYKYINAMDDSGIENIKKTKLSYRPLKLASPYIIYRGLK